MVTVSIKSKFNNCTSFLWSRTTKDLCSQCFFSYHTAVLCESWMQNWNANSIYFHGLGGVYVVSLLIRNENLHCLSASISEESIQNPKKIVKLKPNWLYNLEIIIWFFGRYTPLLYDRIFILFYRIFFGVYNIIST